MLPAAFLEAIATAPGFDKAAFEQAHQQPAPQSIRLNPAKAGWDDSHLQPAGQVLWCPQGRYLAQRPQYTLDPLLHAGGYYVQEASSMFVHEAVRQCLQSEAPVTALDLCAAPGGKSTLLQAALPPGSVLVSNEVIKSRANILTENITKWGGANVVVTNNDPAHFNRLPGFFDLLLVDAPCSGSGLFRKDPAAITEWSMNNVTLCSQRQQRIMADVLPALKEGGILLYATCSYSPEEDETILNWLATQGGLVNMPLTLPPDWHITASTTTHGTGYRFYPNKVQGEGFFIACMQKTATATSYYTGSNKKQELPTAAELAVVQHWLHQPKAWRFIKQQDELLALPPALAEHLPALQQLYIKKAGIRLGKVIGKELVPHHELALSMALHPDVAAVSINVSTALQYLRHQSFTLDTPQKGWHLLRYEGLGLGWAKLLPNRVNNYYPKEWRILMQ